MSLLRQAFCTLIVCSNVMCTSLMFGWPSSTAKKFASNETVLERPMTTAESTLFGSLMPLASLFSTPLCGFLLDKLGRKYCCVLFALPQIIAWSIISITSKVEGVLAAIFISGIGGCMFVIVPLYVSEICADKVRGAMTSCVTVLNGIGLIISYTLSHFEYNTVSFICLTIAVVNVVMMVFMKESPVLLMKKGDMQGAAQSIAYYRAKKANSDSVLKEMEVLKRGFDVQMNGLSPEEEKLKSESTSKAPSPLKFIKNSKSTQKALFLVLGIQFLSIFQGMVVVQVYAQVIFDVALPSVSGNLSSIVFGVVSTFAATSCVYFVEKFGRRPLMIYGSLVTAISCTILGTQIQWQWAPHWLSGIFMFSYAICFNISSGSVPFVIMAEIFLPEIRSLLTMAAIQWAWLAMSLCLMVFNTMVPQIGMAPAFYVFAASGAISSAFCYFRLPETKALPVDEIQILLMRKNT